MMVFPISWRSTCNGSKCIPITRIHSEHFYSASSSPLLLSGVNHLGAERDCPLQSFEWGTAVLTIPPKVKASEGHCWVLLREISKEYITYYNFESAIVKLQFPLCILTSGESNIRRA